MTTAVQTGSYLEVTRLNNIPVFSFGSLVFEQIPTQILYPKTESNGFFRASNFVSGERLSFPEGRANAIREWFRSHSKSEQ